MKSVSNSVPVNSVGHDVVEVLGCDESVFVEVGFIEHVVVLLLSQVLAQVLADLLEFESCELSLNYATVTDRLGSKALKTLLISALVSFSPILAVASLRNSAKSIPPD